MKLKELIQELQKLESEGVGEEDVEILTCDEYHPVCFVSRNEEGVVIHTEALE